MVQLLQTKNGFEPFFTLPFSYNSIIKRALQALLYLQALKLQRNSRFLSLVLPILLRACLNRIQAVIQNFKNLVDF